MWILIFYDEMSQYLEGLYWLDKCCFQINNTCVSNFCIDERHIESSRWPVDFIVIKYKTSSQYAVNDFANL